jgi:hypothetical protein
MSLPADEALQQETWLPVIAGVAAMIPLIPARKREVKRLDGK